MASYQSNYTHIQMKTKILNKLLIQSTVTNVIVTKSQIRRHDCFWKDPFSHMLKTRHVTP